MAYDVNYVSGINAIFGHRLDEISNELKFFAISLSGFIIEENEWYEINMLEIQSKLNGPFQVSDN